MSGAAPLVIIGGKRFRLRLGFADASLQSIVAILQAADQPPFNDHHNLRRMAIGLCEMMLQFGPAHGVSDPEQMIKFAQDLLRDEFYPLHAARQERLAQQARPI